jgi:hypothetical protein
MTHLKTIISTNDIIENVKLHVEATIEHYNKGDETWVLDLSIADTSVTMLAMYARNRHSKFDETWDEIIRLTNFKKLYTIKEVCDKLHEWR